MHKTIKNNSIACNENPLKGFKNPVFGKAQRGLFSFGTRRPKVRILSPRLCKPLFYKFLRESPKHPADSLFPARRKTRRILCAEGCYCPYLPGAIKAAIQALVKPFSGESE